MESSPASVAPSRSRQPAGLLAGRIDVLIVDDHRLLADGIVRLLEREPDIAVVGVASSCAEGIRQARLLQPSVVIVDYVLPDGDGVDMARELHAEHPGVRVVLLTGSGLPRALREALDAECAAFVEKTKAYEELVAVIRAVSAGETVYPLDRLAELPSLDQLRVHYQPVMDLTHDRMVGVEALVRWQHPTRGLLPPAEFIQAAEDNGFIESLGVAVLERACWQAVRWRAQLPRAADLTMAVNVSPRQLDDPFFTASVARVLTESGLPAEALVVELTETSVARNPASVATHLASLDSLGVRLAVDDFGTGYASLQQLRELPFHLLKVDRQFVNGLLAAHDDEAIIRATVDLAHDLSLTVVGEGVETRDQLSSLQALGCDLAQGYLWTKPLPPSELELWWDRYLPQPVRPPLGMALEGR